jgi:cold shock CspA family protein
VIAGRVTAFDQHRGLGEVMSVDGVVHPFHCVEIADGSRNIAAGRDVMFAVRRKLGRLEAVGLRSV